LRGGIINKREVNGMELWMNELGKFPMWHSNQGWRARIVVIYPGGGWHHISDFHKLAPKGVAMAGNGVPRHKDESKEEMMHLDEQVVNIAASLASYKPDVTLWCCTAGSFLKGKGHDKRLIREMEKVTKGPCTTTATAVMAAFKQLRMKKICLVTPYPDDVNEIEKKFFEDNGFKVPIVRGLDLVDNSIIAHVSQNVLYRLAKAAYTPEADGVFISCTGLDVLDIIEPLENDIKKPVVTSNQASFWHAFKLAKVGDPIQGYGRLLREPR
jgi:maleate isomerase